MIKFFKQFSQKDPKCVDNFANLFHLSKKCERVLIADILSADNEFIHAFRSLSFDNQVDFFCYAIGRNRDYDRCIIYNILCELEAPICGKIEIIGKIFYALKNHPMGNLPIYWEWLYKVGYRFHHINFDYIFDNHRLILFYNIYCKNGGVNCIVDDIYAFYISSYNRNGVGAGQYIDQFLSSIVVNA